MIENSRISNNQIENLAPNNKLVYIFFNLILILFSFEYLSIGEGFSVFRILILPISLLGLFIIKIKLRKSNILFLFIFSIVLFFSFLTNIEDPSSALLNIAGILFFVLFLYSFISKLGFPKSGIWIISFYTIPHLVFLIYEFLSGNTYLILSGLIRFSGMHYDPNFMCIYLTIAFISKLYLLKNICKKRSLMIFFTFLITIDVALIIFSQSRAGLISLFIALFAFLVINFKINKVLAKICLAFIIFFIISNFLLKIDVKEIPLFSSIFNRFDKTHFDDEEARVAHLNNFINLYNDESYYFKGYSIDKYLKTFNQYSHNLIVDIMLDLGLIVGMFFILYIFYLFIRGIYMSRHCFINSYLFNLSFIAFISSLTLSSYKQKFFWLIVIFAYFSSKKIINNKLYF